jgi:hypothetical protein
VSALELADRPLLDAELGAWAAIVAEHHHGDGNHLLGQFLRMWQGAVALFEGRTAEARALAAEIRRTTPTESNFVNSAGAQSLLAARDTGRLASLAEPLAQLAAAVPELVTLQCELALTLAETGEVDRARELVAALAADACAAIPFDTLRPAAVALLAEAAVLVGVGDATRAEIERALEPFGGLIVVMTWGVACLGAADRFLGQLAARRGDRLLAVDLLERALASEHRLGAPALEARTHASLAALVEDGAIAATHAAAAREIVERLGLHGIAVPELR